MTTNNDGFDPTWDGLGDFREDDGLTEDCATEDISDLLHIVKFGYQVPAEMRQMEGMWCHMTWDDGMKRGVSVLGREDTGASQRRRRTYSSVGASPHFLQVKLLHAFLVGGDSCALDTDMVLQDGIGCVDGDLVVGLQNEDLREESRKK